MTEATRSIELFVPKMTPDRVRSMEPLRLVLRVTAAERILNLHDALCLIDRALELRSRCYQPIQPLEFYDADGRWEPKAHWSPDDSSPTYLCVGTCGVYWVDRYHRWSTGAVNIADIRGALDRIKASSVPITVVLDWHYSGQG